jgi:3-phosphoglycerate kinase
LKQNGVFQYFSFISTGGGAFLEFIKGDGLPGLDSLNE